MRSNVTTSWCVFFFLVRTRISHCTRKACWNQHSTVNLHVRIACLMNYLLNVTCLSGSVRTHVTLEAFLLVSPYPCARPSYLDDGMDPSVETVLDPKQVTRSKKLILKNANALMMFKNVIPPRTMYGRILAVHNLLLKTGVNDFTFKHEQAWNAPSSLKSSWQAVGEIDARAPLLPPKTHVQLYSSKQHGLFPDR